MYSDEIAADHRNCVHLHGDLSVGSSGHFCQVLCVQEMGNLEDRDNERSTLFVARWYIRCLQSFLNSNWILQRAMRHLGRNVASGFWAERLLVGIYSWVSTALLYRPPFGSPFKYSYSRLMRTT